MKYPYHKTSLIGLCLLLTSLLPINISCYTSKIPDSAYQLEPIAVSIHYTADEKLNLYNNQPHALTLVVYQLTMPDLYYKYIAKSSGIEDLLRMEVEDPTITGKNRIDIQPGDKKLVEFARYTGTKYVAIVAGYDQLESGKVSEIFDIPVKQDKKLLFKPVSSIEKLLIYLQLGPEQIDKITANDKVRPNDGDK
jgi:type VI secretion system VasD/TssJ family lipoprotein